MAHSRTLGPDPVAAALAAFLGEHPAIGNLRVALSGGRDSAVLLHALTRTGTGRAVEVIHIHHGLHPRADAQAAHCREFTQRLGLVFEERRIRIPPAPDEGLEAAARRLRYQALTEGLSPGDCVLTGQHAMDQAETFLLAALKGSGPSGLAAMPRLRRLGPGWLGRPLLECPGAAVADYAARHGLSWVEDPSNADRRFDRNFIRHEVMPVLAQRFPVEWRLGAAAALQADAVRVLDGLLDGLLRELCGPDGDTLDISALLAQAREYRSWLLRRFALRSGFPAPRRGPLLEFLRQLEEASSEARPELHWEKVSLRSHAGRLHLVPAEEVTWLVAERGMIDWPAGEASLRLPDGTVLTRDQLRAAGVDDTQKVRICFRHGGEILSLAAGRRSLKKLMQERGVPPWLRARVPLVWVGNELVAALWDR